MTAVELAAWLRADKPAGHELRIAADQIEAMQREIEKLRQELSHTLDGYQKLAQHHNDHCTCLDIY